MQVLLYGLESSGKSTIIKSFQEGQFTSGIPFTAQKYSEIRLTANVNFDILEVGGRRDVRRIAVESIDRVDAIIFVIDGSNEGSFKNAKIEFEKILLHPQSRGKPLAILFHKKDIAQVHPAVIIEKLHLLDRIDRPHKVFSTTAKNPQDFGQVLNWIHKRLTDKDSLLEDRETRFYKILILDILNNQKKGLPILA
ncbi:MAG: ADP-ribosylation factor-like protein, partial [Candidatus Hodarchaeales archaeon]